MTKGIKRPTLKPEDPSFIGAKGRGFDWRLDPQLVPGKTGGYSGRSRRSLSGVSGKHAPFPLVTIGPSIFGLPAKSSAPGEELPIPGSQLAKKGKLATCARMTNWLPSPGPIRADAKPTYRHGGERIAAKKWVESAIRTCANSSIKVRRGS